MQKEILIVIVILFVIVIADVITQNYTKTSIKEINNKLDEIQQISENLEQNKDVKSANNTTNANTSETDEQQNEGTGKNGQQQLSSLKNRWTAINKTMAFYIEHDELEKVNSSMAKIESYIKLCEYTEAIPEIENCKYILGHIQEKEEVSIINLF